MATTKVDVEQSTFMTQLALPEYERVFQDYGIDHQSMTADQASQRVRSRAKEFRLALIAGLDHWAELESSFGDLT